MSKYCDKWFVHRQDRLIWIVWRANYRQDSYRFWIHASCWLFVCFFTNKTCNYSLYCLLDVVSVLKEQQNWLLRSLVVNLILKRKKLINNYQVRDIQVIFPKLAPYHLVVSMSSCGYHTWFCRWIDYSWWTWETATVNHWLSVFSDSNTTEFQDDLETVSPIDVIDLFLRSNFWNLLVTKTNQYLNTNKLPSKSRFRDWKPVTVLEMKAFFYTIFRYGSCSESRNWRLTGQTISWTQTFGIY